MTVASRKKEILLSLFLPVTCFPVSVVLIIRVAIAKDQSHDNKGKATDCKCFERSDEII